MGKQINDTEYLDYLIGPQICFGGYFSPFLRFLRIYWENIKKKASYIIITKEVVKSVIIADLHNGNEVLFVMYTRCKNCKNYKTVLNTDDPLPLDLLRDNELKEKLLMGQQVIIQRDFHLSCRN